MITPRLLAAYRRTEYEAAGAVARVGRRSAKVDALLRRMGVREAAFVTAWNPCGRRMPLGWNERMQARLREAVRRWAGAEGHGRGRVWSEAHLLAGMPEGRAVSLARRFRQAGIVTVRVGRQARLVIGDRQTAPPAA
jgi:hypothetical protein